jgi:hypothetical protein
MVMVATWIGFTIEELAMKSTTLTRNFRQGILKMWRSHFSLDVLHGPQLSTVRWLILVDVANATAGSAEALFPSWKAVPDFPRVDAFPGQVYQKKTRRFLDSSLHLV